MPVERRRRAPWVRRPARSPRYDDHFYFNNPVDYMANLSDWKILQSMVNAIMRLGLFKGYVIGQIEETMRDLVGAAAALSSEGLDKVLSDPGFSEEERARDPRAGPFGIEP